MSSSYQLAESCSQPQPRRIPSAANEPPRVLVIHETSGRKYMEALAVLKDQGSLASVEFAGASVFWKFGHSLIREHKGVGAAIEESWRNLKFRLRFWRIKDTTIILALPPWDYRFLLYSTLRRRNRLIYNTSWPYWHKSRVPRRLSIFTPLMRRLWKRVLSDPEVSVVAVTPAAAKSISSTVNLGRPPATISHVVSDTFFRVRARYAKPFRLLFVGELSKKKGLLILSRLLDLLRSELVTVDIVGDGPLRNVARRIAQRPGCRWLGQITDRAQLARIAGDSQLLISPAIKTRRWEELFGISILEAMAAGLPCIVSDHVGPRTIITSGRDGVLIPENAVTEMAAWVTRLQDRKEEWESISKQAVSTAKKYSMPEVTALWQSHLTPPLEEQLATTVNLARKPRPHFTSRRLRVVSVSHTAVFRSGRLRYLPLAQSDEIDLTLIVPQKWKEYGREINADPPTPSLNMKILPVRFRDAGRAKWYMHFYPGLAALVNELQPDVLHLWEEPWSIVALQAAHICRSLRPAPVLILETEQNILRQLPAPFEQIRKYTLKRTELLIARTPAALQVSQACGYRGKSATIDYCIDPGEFCSSGRAEARREFGASGFAIGYAGRLVPEKGLATVLEALRDSQAEVQLLLLGDGPDRERLDRMVREFGLGDRVHFFPAGSPQKVARFLNALDALVLVSLTYPSWKEQFGRVIMEAHACGVPVIGSDSGSIPSVVGRGGWIVKESDPKGLRSLIERLGSNPGEVAAAGAEGLKQAGTRFSMQKVSSDLGNAFMQAAQKEAVLTC